jgi:hypothetical protein
MRLKLKYKILVCIGVILIVVLFTGRYCWKLEREIPQDILTSALEFSKGKKKIIKNHNCIILIDYRLPVFIKRLWLYDVNSGRTVLNCHVAHSFHSGWIYAEKYSNEPKSYLSCYGAFLTTNSYQGNFGYSMRINGLESTNSNTSKRAIVFHPLVDLHPYGIRVPAKFALYSQGCFAVYDDVLRAIISKTKNGALVFVKRFE